MLDNNLYACDKMATPMSPQQPTSPPSVMPKSHVGFDSITNQIERKLLKRGFQFNVICVGQQLLIRCQENYVLTFFAGQTGLGKSTLINTLFASHLIDSKGRLSPDQPVRATTEISPTSHGKSFRALKVQMAENGSH